MSTPSKPGIHPVVAEVTDRIVRRSAGTRTAYLARVDAVDKYTVRFYNATPDVTIEGRLQRYGSDIMNRRAWEGLRDLA